MALMSGKTYSNTGTPSNADGVDGDIFMQLDGLKTTYRKEGGVWTAFGNQLGTIPEFLKGIGVPSNSLGADNQYYRDVNTDVIYEKSTGVWTNIGSWTSLALETQQLLQSNGIGADLAVTNHVSNIDTFTEAGAEGYFDNTTTGTTPDVYGRVKVRRVGGDCYQEAQTFHNKASTRFSSDEGTTWTAWRTTANEDGDSTRKFKALAGVADDDVAVVGQLPAAPPELFGSTYNYLATGETLTIPPLGVRRIVIIGGGGGSAGYETGDGTAGGESRLNVQGSGTLIAKALGGLGAFNGAGAPAGTPWPADRGRSGVEYNGDYLPFVLSASMNDPELVYLSKVAGYGEGGGRGYPTGIPNTVPAGFAGHGGVLEFLLKNNSPNIPLVLAATVGTGGVKSGGNANNGAAGVIAYRT